MILLTFNILNNKPETTSGSLLSNSQLLEITISNTNAIIRLLELHDIRCTFFIDVALVGSLPQLMKKLVSKGHEVALYNNGSSREAVGEAKDFAEKITEKPVRGIRRKTARLSVQDLKDLNFIYISDIENAGILFPFRRLERTTEIFEDSGVSIIPESISPYSQIPYNDFVFQMLPMEYYKSMVTETLKNEEFVMIYLNTWQFTNHKENQLKIPFYRRHNTGKKMEDKLEEFLRWIDDKEHATTRIKDYIF